VTLIVTTLPISLGTRQMERKTLNEVRAAAAEMASKHGHQMTDWRPDYRPHFCFTSSCTDCRSWGQVQTWKLTPEEAEKAAQTGYLIAQDAHAFSDDNYVIALGSALILGCWKQESPLTP
jgi:hypothetical protein